MPAIPAIEAVAAIVGIANAMNQPKKPKKARVISLADAMTQAESQLNPLYDQRSKVVLRDIQSDLNNRGFSGQKAGTELAASIAMDNERRRIAAINGLAQSIRQGSADDSYRQSALDYQYYLNSKNASMQGLNNSLNWLDSAGEDWPINYKYSTTSSISSPHKHDPWNTTYR